MNAARINLLPHRAERRARAKKHFGLVSGLAAALGLVIVLAVHITYADLISNQEGRNQRPRDLGRQRGPASKERSEQQADHGVPVARSRHFLLRERPPKADRHNSQEGQGGKEATHRVVATLAASVAA